MANNYKQYKKAKKEKNQAEKGILVGGTLAGIGGANLLGTEYIKRNLGKITEAEGPTISELESATARGKKLIPIRENINPEQLKTAKKVGAGLAIAGGTLAGLSAYQHHKAKKKLKELEGNDNKKKK